MRTAKGDKEEEGKGVDFSTAVPSYSFHFWVVCSNVRIADRHVWLVLWVLRQTGVFRRARAVRKWGVAGGKGKGKGGQSG